MTFDQPIADNLGLDFKVVYAGSEAAELAALDAAYTKEGPILFYFWTPHWAQAKYDLTHGRAARGDAGVRGRRPPNDVDEYACALPAGPAVQGVQRGSRDRRRPRRSRSCRRCNYTNDDQNAIALDDQQRERPDEAAQNWIDANPDIWQPWVDAGLAAQG